jgi:Ca2+/Na+ antiporter
MIPFCKRSFAERYHNLHKSADQSECSTYPPLTSRTISQTSESTYSYFDSVAKECKQWAPNDDVGPGCVPFNSLASCRKTCKAYAQEGAGDGRDGLRREELEKQFVFHFSIMVYVCFALALLCEEFFVSALEIIIEKLQLPPDVAGATFMAAGSSSPELFVAAVAVFFLPDAGHRCVLSQLHEDGSSSTPDNPVFAGACASPDDNLGWLTDPYTTAACSLVDPDGQEWVGQRIYIDEGVGVGAVVGSTMFNTMCIIGGSAIVSAGTETTLDWRIVMRDGTFYMISIIMLSVVLNRGSQSEPEPILAFFDKDSESCRKLQITEYDARQITEEHNADMLSHHVWNHTGVTELQGDVDYCEPKVYGLDGEYKSDPLAVVSGLEASVLLCGYASYVIICACWARFVLPLCPQADKAKALAPDASLEDSIQDHQDAQMESARESGHHRLARRELEAQRIAQVRGRRRGDASSDMAAMAAAATEFADQNPLHDQKGGDDVDPDIDHMEDVNPMASFDIEDDGADKAEPTDEPSADIVHAGAHEHSIWQIPKSITGKAFWAVSFPIMLPLSYTVPDCRKEKFKKWYLLTFGMSIVWMGILVDILVEHAMEAFEGILAIGALGLTFVAAGTSFPDFLSSIIVAKRGLADMAVSNAFGSNIFDDLLGLGFPWMMQTCVVDPGAVLYVGSMAFLNTSFYLLVAIAMGRKVIHASPCIFHS